jgi:hypothetical protein
MIKTDLHTLDKSALSIILHLKNDIPEKLVD